MKLVVGTVRTCRVCRREFTHFNQYRLVWSHMGKYGASLDWRYECRWKHNRSIISQIPSRESRTKV